MTFLKNIKRKIGTYILERYVVGDNRKPIVHNLDGAKSIGILFDATGEENFSIAKNYHRLIKEEYGIRNVRALGYYSEKQEAPYLQNTIQVNYFTNKELNWYLKPEGDIVKDFLSEKYDVLIDLTENDLLPIQFILAESKSRFKIGRYSKYNAHFYDLMIDVKNKSLTYFIEQATIYLTTINQKITA